MAAGVLESAGVRGSGPLAVRPMRITFVLPHANLSGGTRVVAMYARKLTERGHDVCVISAPPPRATVKDRLRSLAKGRWLPGVEPAGPSHLDGLAIEHRILDRRRKLVDADVPDADVIIATWWETAEWIRSLSPVKGAQAYFTQHGEAVLFPPDAVEGGRRVEATGPLPIHKFAVANWLAELGVRRGVEDRIAVVPNAVDHRVFVSPVRGKQTVPTVGFMYSTTRFKGCDIALAAIQIARQRLPALRVLAFGLDAPSESLPLPVGTVYAERPLQERIPEIYSSCDAWLFSSRSEGFGLPILEAMACRTPVIGTPAGPSPELLGAGGGVLVRPDDAPMIAPLSVLRVLATPIAAPAAAPMMASRLVFFTSACSPP